MGTLGMGIKWVRTETASLYCVLTWRAGPAQYRLPRRKCHARQYRSANHRMDRVAKASHGGAAARCREPRFRLLRQGGRRCGGRAIRAHFAEHGIEAWREPHEVFGDAVHALVTKPGSNEKPIVLMGHRDTVFPKGEAARRPFRIEGGRAYGPGVADMKAGLVMNAFVAAAFHKFGGAPRPIKLLITSDEEIGSPPVAADHRGEGARRPRGVQLRARPADRQRRHRPQGRRVHGMRESPARRRIPAAISRTASARSARSRTRSCSSQRDRPRGGHHPQCRAGLRRPVGQHRRAPRRRSGSTCAMSIPPIAPRRWRRSRPSSPRRPCRARRRSCTSTANSCRWCRARRRKSCSIAIRGGEGCRPAQPRGRIRRRLRQFRLHRQRRHPDDLRRRPGWRQSPYRAGISRARQHRSARPGARAGDPQDRRRLICLIRYCNGPVSGIAEPSFIDFAGAHSDDEGVKDLRARLESTRAEPETVGFLSSLPDERKLFLSGGICQSRLLRRAA